MQLASILSISCNIQRLAQQQSQHNLQWWMLRKELFATSAGQIWQINKAFHPMTPSSEWSQEGLGNKICLSPRNTVQLAIEKEACGWEPTRNPILKQWRETEMEWRLCSERNHSCKKASWTCRGGGSARAGRYEESFKCRIDELRPQMKFQEMMVTIGNSLSDLACSNNGEDGEDEDDEEIEQVQLSEDDEPSWVIGPITTTYGSAGIGFGRSRWSLMNSHNRDGRRQETPSVKRIEVRHISIECSRSRWTATGWWCIGFFTDNIWRAYGVSWHCARTIANAARDFSTRK